MVRFFQLLYYHFKSLSMKKKMGQSKKENIQFNAKKPRPEIRDDLQSSTNRARVKGDDRVHLNKDHHKPGKQKP